MKAYKVEVLVLGFENASAEDVERELENSRHLSVTVKSMEERDIGTWHDDHPLNKRDTADAEYRRLFCDHKTNEPS